MLVPLLNIMHYLDAKKVQEKHMVAAYFHLLLQKEYIAAFLCEGNANFTQEQNQPGCLFFMTLL